MKQICPWHSLGLDIAHISTPKLINSFLWIIVLRGVGHCIRFENPLLVLYSHHPVLWTLGESGEDEHLVFGLWHHVLWSLHLALLPLHPRHLISASHRIQIPKILVELSIGKSVGNPDMHTLLVGALIGTATLEAIWQHLLKCKTCTPCDSAVTVLHVFSRETVAHVQMFAAASIIRVKNWTTQMSVSRGMIENISVPCSG